MYVVEPGERLVVQDIGPQATQQWDTILQLSRDAIQATHEAKMAMLDLPGTVQQRIEREMQAVFAESTHPRTGGNNVQSATFTGAQMAQIAHILPKPLLELLSIAHRKEARAEATRHIFWCDMEDQFSPEPITNLGVRAHEESGKKVYALVILGQSNATPEQRDGHLRPTTTVDDFLHDLFGKPGDNKATREE